jgi:Flp pilus assembly protein TadD
MSDRIEATERLIATLIAGQARVRHIAHSRLSFAAALAIEMRAQTGLAQRWSVGSAVAERDEVGGPPQKRPRIAPTVQSWNEDLDQDDLVSEPVPVLEEAELAPGDEHPASDEETSEADVGPSKRRAVTFSDDDDSDEELVQRIEARRDDDRSAPSDEDADDPDTEEVEEDPVPAAAASGGDEEGQTFVPPALETGAPSYWERSSHGDDLGDDDATALHPPGSDEDDDPPGPASSTFSSSRADDLEPEDLRTGEVRDDLEAEDLRTGEVRDDVDPDELEEDEIELDDDSVEVELDESDREEERPRAAARATTPPPVNEWEEEDRTMLSGSHNEWDGEERTVLHGSEMASVLEEEDAVPGPPSRNRAPSPAFVDEDDSDSFGEVSDEDVEDSGTGQAGAAAVRILGVGKAEPVTGTTRKRARHDEDASDPGTQEGVVAASGAEDGDDWGAGLAGASGGLSLLGKRKSDDGLPSIPKLTEEESQEVGGAAVDGAVVDLDQGSLQAVEEVDPAQLRSFQRAAEEAVSKGDMHQAIVHYRDMLDLAPENLDAYLGRGRCLVHLGDYAAAMSDFQRAEDLDPKSPLPLVEMGNLFFARKEYLRAIQFFDTALELDDKNAWAWCYRGICHHYRKKHKEAFQDLQKAYSLDPEIPNIRRYVQMAVKAMEKSTDGA